jgi:hypothetical protein
VAEEQQIFQRTRLLLDLAFNGRELSPDYVDGEGVEHAIERADDLQDGADALSVVGKEAMKSERAQHCIRSRQYQDGPHTSHPGFIGNYVDRAGRFLVAAIRHPESIYRKVSGATTTRPL